MKQLILLSCNEFYVPDLTAHAEMILTIMEPAYKIVGCDLDPVKELQTETVRFCADADRLRSLAKDFEKMADKLDALTEKVRDRRGAKES